MAILAKPRPETSPSEGAILVDTFRVSAVTALLWAALGAAAGREVWMDIPDSHTYPIE